MLLLAQVFELRHKREQTNKKCLWQVLTWSPEKDTFIIFKFLQRYKHLAFEICFFHIQSVF